MSINVSNLMCHKIVNARKANLSQIESREKQDLDMALLFYAMYVYCISTVYVCVSLSK